MRFAAVSLALCATAIAIPLDATALNKAAPDADTSVVKGLTAGNSLVKTGGVSARQVPDTSSVTDLADTSAVTGAIPSGLPVRVREVTDDVTSDESDPLISILGAAPIATRNIVDNGGFPTQASPDSGLLEDLILEVRHIRFAIVKGIKDELKDLDPSLGREVSQIINELNRTERELFKDVGLPGNIYHKLMIVVGEINHVVKTIEGFLIKETDIIDPSVSSLIASLLADVNSLSSNVDKVVGINPVPSSS